jgi:hypothetical protein
MPGCIILSAIHKLQVAAEFRHDDLGDRPLDLIATGLFAVA